MPLGNGVRPLTLCTFGNESQHGARAALLAGEAPHPLPQNLGLCQAGFRNQALQEISIVLPEVYLNRFSYRCRPARILRHSVISYMLCM